MQHSSENCCILGIGHAVISKVQGTVKVRQFKKVWNLNSTLILFCNPGWRERPRHSPDDRAALRRAPRARRAQHEKHKDTWYLILLLRARSRPYRRRSLQVVYVRVVILYTRIPTCCLQDNFFNFFRMASTTLRLVDYDFQRFQDRFDYSSDYWLVDHDLKKIPRCARLV